MSIPDSPPVSHVGRFLPTAEQADLLRQLARRYVWWKTPDAALENPCQIIVQVMNLGDYADVQNLIATVGEDTLRTIVQTAQAGEFEPRSWHYWHYRLRLARRDGEVPPLPTRSNHDAAP